MSKILNRDELNNQFAQLIVDGYDHTCIGEDVIMEAREVTHTRSCLAVLENLIFYGLTRYDDKPHQFWNQMRIAAEFVGNTEAAELFNEYYENGCPFNRSPQPIQSDKVRIRFPATSPMGIGTTTDAVMIVGLDND